MVKHQAREDAIEGTITVGQAGGPAFVQGEGRLRSRRLGPGDGQHVGVGVQARDLRLGVQAFDEKCQSACATSKIQDAEAWSNVGSPHQGALEGLLAHDPTQKGVVQRGQPMKAERRDVGPVFFQGFLLPQTSIPQSMVLHCQRGIGAVRPCSEALTFRETGRAELWHGRVRSSSP
jgi:hypothetical protein